MLPPVSEIGELCAWLDAEHDWIVHDEFSVLQADYVTEVFDLQRRALSLLDTGRRTFHLLGPCDVHTDGHGACTTEVYAQEDRDSATCKGCGFEHNVADKREWLREQLRERLGTTEEAAAFASTYHGFTVTVQAVNNWINREYVKVRGKDTQGRRLLSVEDVLVQAGMRTVRKRTGGA